MGAFVDYGVGHPAFVDCAQELMRYRGDDLLAAITEGALFRLGRGISQCLSILTVVLEELGVEDAVLLANTLYASGLGALQLARVGILVTEVAPGVPTVGSVSPDQVRAHPSPRPWRSRHVSRQVASARTSSSVSASAADLSSR